MNPSKYFCHSCDKLVDGATQEPTGECKCKICKDPYVELISEEDEMVIEDYNPETDQVEEEVMDVERVPQPEFRHSTFNFNFNVNINAQNVFSSSSSSSGGARNPQPYSFVGGDRTEVHMPSPPRRREPQPYSHVFVDPPQQRPPRQQRSMPRRPRRQPPVVGFQAMFADLGDMDFGFPPAQGRRRGFAPPQGLFGNFHRFFDQAPMAGRAHPRDYFQGNMNDLLARMHRQHEAENGKPPAAKSVIDMLPTSCLTKASAEALADSCCAVCQDNYKVGDTVCKLPCGHEYHKDCVHPWLERHCTCPVCRHEVGEESQQQQEQASQAA